MDRLEKQAYAIRYLGQCKRGRLRKSWEEEIRAAAEQKKMKQKTSRRIWKTKSKPRLQPLKEDVRNSI